MKALAAIALLCLAGCAGVQSALHAHGPVAERIASLGWVLFVGAAVIFIAVVALTAYAVLARRDRAARLGHSALVITAGIVFPVVTLTALLIVTLLITRDSGAHADDEPLRIEVVGAMWWWRVRYVSHDAGHDAKRGDAVDVETANEIRVPIGRPVELALRSNDVLHSFWVPGLAGKLDLIPGRVNTLRLQASQAGVFRGQCAEFCGAQHAKMAFHVVALEPDQFDAWLASQRRPAQAPTDSHALLGRSLFLQHCSACHAIRGTSANGRTGPDLTHVGGRDWLAAGLLPNNQGTLAAWIASSDHLKPGNGMPSFDVFTGTELRALAAYLHGLR